MPGDPMAFRGPVLCVALALLTAAGCDSASRLPAQSSPEYLDAVSAFNVGLAALQVGDDVEADARLAALTRIAPGEPAGWANWGVLALRQRNFGPAAQRLERARELAPADARLYHLRGLLERNRGDSAQAIAQFRKALELDPRDLRAGYALAEEVERQADADSDINQQQILERLLAAQPDNLALLLEFARVAAKRGDAAAFATAATRIDARSVAWPAEVRERLAALKAAAAAGDLRAAATGTTFLRNTLMRLPEYRQNLARIKAPPGEEAQPLARFVKLPQPPHKGAPADAALTFASAAPRDGTTGGWSWAGALPLGSEGAPVLATASARELSLATGARLPFPGGGVAPSPDGILALDFDYDFLSDLVLAGAGGVRLFRQDKSGTLVDVTAKARLARAAVERAYTGAWAADIEADGDLDAVLAAREAAPVVLRNNGDGTFAEVRPFKGVAGLRAFVWADIDGDGNPDAAMIDGARKLRFFANERKGNFRERSTPAALPAMRALAAADADGDGVLDLLALQADGAIVRISDRNGGQAWESARIGAFQLPGEARLLVADLDNNGALDLIVAPASGGAHIWLGEATGAFAALAQPQGPQRVFGAADLDRDGKLDLLGLSAEGRLAQAVNRAPSNYHWVVIRPRAASAVADQRINPFGVGGEIEVRAGLLVQKQPITGPQLHFGTGVHDTAEVVRVAWPNGTVHAEFAVKGDRQVLTEQRLKGSCPFLFTWNGREMEFVKDAVPWGSAIGLSINTLGSMKILATAEWYKIRGDQLVPRDGYYDARITAELWEVYYYDYLALMTVDHPAGTEIFVDERFVVPPAKLGITATETPRPIARAVDDHGKDVTAIVGARDGKALDSFGGGQYQGVTREHYLEVDLGAEAPAAGPLYLIAHGSIRPTESSVNIAIAQGSRWRARNLSLEVPDGKGGWVLARDNLGFPAGRKKTVLFDLSGVFLPSTPRKVRIRTNLEIYWDHLEWARGLPGTQLRTTRLAPSRADLQYRGYSVIALPDAGAPEVPDYHRMAGSKQRWRDLEGYYTRYGDVRELLAGIDDRYVIVNSGDEMALRFPEQPPPPQGWVRDYVIMGDGWIKDGDYNSTHSKTVLPLPYHARQDYEDRPGRLEDEWPYRRHPQDWQNYHTRYVTPDVLRNALRTKTAHDP